MKMLKYPFLTALFSLVLAIAVSQNAQANLVQNADFSSISYSGTLPMTTLYGQFGTGTGSTLTVSNWTTSGYNFVYAPGTADQGTQASGANAGQPKQAPGQYNAPSGYGSTYMWGPNNGSSNGLPSTSPVGGNFIAMDGAFETAAVSQVITGLTIGQVYVLKFYWAGAQQEGFTGTTTDNITATLGSQNFTTSTVSLASKGFSGWTQQTFYYTATATSETLSFLAAGTPTGEPPFSLLGGIDLQVIPDFSNWMVFTGFGIVCIIFEAMRRRRRKSESRASLFCGTTVPEVSA